MTGQPQKDDFYIPPATAGTPPPKGDGNDMTWIIIGIAGIFILFGLPLIIAAFVIGMASDSTSHDMAGRVAHMKVVAATVQQPDAGNIILTYQGGQDAGTMIGITTTVTDSTGLKYTKVMGSQGGTTPLDVGEDITFEGAFAGKDHVVSTAWFTDGTEQVILDNYV